MKKQILTIAGIVGMALGVMAQGSINQVNNTGLFFTYGNNQNTLAATTYFTGGLSLGIFFSTSASAGQITAIDAQNGLSGGGAAAQALLAGAGFSQVATVTGAANNNNSISGFADPITLSAAYAASTAGSYAFVFTSTSGAQTGFSGVVAFGGANYGGNPGATPTPGTPYSVNGNATLSAFSAANNLDLTTTSVPEPGTMALAALGSASLLLFRRRNINK